MLSSLWEGLGGKMAERLAAAGVPALIFWLGVAVAWIHAQGGLSAVQAKNPWLEAHSPTNQLVAGLAVLLGIAASGLAMQLLAMPILRLLEGYWPSWMDPLARVLVRRSVARAEADERRWQFAQARFRESVPTPEDLTELRRLDHRLRWRPSNTMFFMPTPIGNILRAAERRSAEKYGLDAVVVWPRLWLLLPEEVRTELRSSRTAMDTAAVSVAWALLFCTLAPFTLLAVPTGLIVAVVIIVLVIPSRARQFGDLVEAAYDIFRTSLYREIRWPLPATPAEERIIGMAISMYLLHGSDATEPIFAGSATSNRNRSDK